jgi:hypothetical protein
LWTIARGRGRPVRGSGADRKTEKEKKTINIAPETQKLGW